MGSIMGRIRDCALVLAVASVGAFGAGAVLADWEPSAVGISDLQGEADWTGFYIGGKLGGTRGDVDWTTDANVFNPFGVSTPVNFSPSGFSGGIIGGGNLQVGHWVFGAEFSYSGVDLSQTTTSPFLPARDTFSSKLDYIGTVEGRIGYSFYDFLAFVKGGWAGSNATLTGTNTATGFTASTDNFVDGWTIGGGLELLCWSNIVLGVEYDYITLDLGNSASCPLCASGIVAGTPQSLAGEANLSSVMFRASYLFPPED
jgi:outer membrane immunogenic protein